MNEGNVKKWRRLLKEGKTNVEDEERNARLSLLIDDLLNN